MTTASVARPDAMAKKEAWDRLHGDGYPSLRMSIAAAGGFWFRHQADLTAPYIEPFFSGLREVFTDREQEAAKAYFRAMFPSHVVDQSLRDRIASLLEEDGVGPMLRRLLIEADDDLRRAIECRALAAGMS